MSQTHQTLDEFFAEFKPAKNARNKTLKIPSTTKKQRVQLNEGLPDSKIKNAIKIAEQLRKEQDFICDKATNTDGTLYEIGVLNGIDRILKMMKRQS